MTRREDQSNDHLSHQEQNSNSVLEKRHEEARLAIVFFLCVCNTVGSKIRSMLVYRGTNLRTYSTTLSFLLCIKGLTRNPKMLHLDPTNIICYYNSPQRHLDHIGQHTNMPRYYIVSNSFSSISMCGCSAHSAFAYIEAEHTHNQLILSIKL